MKVSSLDCVRCNPPLKEDLPLAGPARPLCDACTEAARRPWRIVGTFAVPVADAQPAKRKSRRKTNRKATVSATALALLLILIAGCSFHRTTTLDVSFDPRGTLDLPSPETTVEIPTPGIQPTES